MLRPYSQENVKKQPVIKTEADGFKSLMYSFAKEVIHGNLVYFSAFFLNAILPGVLIKLVAIKFEVVYRFEWSIYCWRAKPEINGLNCIS